MSQRKQHWEQIYSEKNPLEVSWYQQEPVLSLHLIENCLSAKDEPIIDIGGGASVLVDRLLEKGYSRLSVLDISENALAFAKKRLGARASEVEWFVSDVTEFVSPHTFSLWHDRAVFHFLTAAEDRKHYVELLNNTLRQGSHVILAAFAIGGPTKCSGLDIVQYDAEKLSNELGGNFMLVDHFDETHITPSGKQQAFTYFHFTKP